MRVRSSSPASSSSAWSRPTTRSPNNAKIGVKLLVAIAVVACAEIAAAKERKGDGARPQLVHAAGALALLNVLVAVLWTTAS